MHFQFLYFNTYILMNIFIFLHAFIDYNKICKFINVSIHVWYMFYNNNCNITITTLMALNVKRWYDFYKRNFIVLPNFIYLVSKTRFLWYFHTELNILRIQVPTIRFSFHFTHKIPSLYSLSKFNLAKFYL